MMVRSPSRIDEDGLIWTRCWGGQGRHGRRV